MLAPSVPVTCVSSARYSIVLVAERSGSVHSATRHYSQRDPGSRRRAARMMAPFSHTDVQRGCRTKAPGVWNDAVAGQWLWPPESSGISGHRLKTVQRFATSLGPYRVPRKNPATAAGQVHRLNGRRPKVPVPHRPAPETSSCPRQGRARPRLTIHRWRVRSVVGGHREPSGYVGEQSLNP